MKRKLLFGIGLAAILIGIGLWLYPGSQSRDEVIEIAAVGPETGIHAPMRRSFRQGMELCMERVNASGGINGRPVKLVLYDDKNQANLAQQRARDIAKRDRALAVIGHQFSSCSIAGGKVYKKHGIPAISPFSTNVAVTRENPWYFRIIYNDDLQGRFLANYAKNVLGYDRASIITEDQKYGQYLTKTFEEMAGEIGLEVAYKWEFERQAPNLEWRLESIVSDLHFKQNPGIVFLAVHAAEGGHLVRFMRDMYMSDPLIAPDSLASDSFAQGFNGLPKEEITPGYYTSGIYVTSPLLFDTADESGLAFKEQYRARYQEDPDWPAAFAHDCMKLVLEAAQRTGVTGQPDTLDLDRKRIRDYLAGMRKPEIAMKGATGLSYFDEYGDSKKPITIGVYKQDNIISALIQFQPRHGPRRREFPLPEDSRIVEFQGHYLYKTHVVYTGVKIHKISEVDFKTGSCQLDFSLWFRYQDELDVSRIEFLNALEPISLGEPIEREQTRRLAPSGGGRGVNSSFSVQKKTGRRHFRLYRAQGRFQTDFMGRPEALAQHTLGIRFRHERLSRKNLIYVPDILGMGDGRSILEKMRAQGVRAGMPGWGIHRVRFFQQVGRREPLGRIRYIDQQAAALDYSGFNFEIVLKEKSLFFQGLSLIPKSYIQLVLAMSVGLLLFSAIPRGGRCLLPGGEHRFAKAIWLMRAFSSLVLLLAVEALVVKQWGEQIPGTIMRVFLTGFEVLWWLVPAILVQMALEPFVWEPMECRSQQPVPNVLRRFVAYIIYFLALYGIVVFVLDQNITKLIATSGAIAALIGFVIKSNISNFFSGIIVNQGNAVGMGHWVKIGDYEEGKVTDITWRSTKVQNRDGNILSIPNSTVSEAVIYNYNFPQKSTQLSVVVHVDPAHSPERIKKILHDAVISAKGVLSDPEPETHFLGFSDWAADYVAEFYINDYDEKSRWHEAVWERIWTHLSLAGIAPALRDADGVRYPEKWPATGSRMAKKTAGDENGAEEREPGPSDQIEIAEKNGPRTPLALLNNLALTDMLSSETKQALSPRMTSRHFKPEAVIVRQGESGDSLFVIAEGVVRVQSQLTPEAEPVEIVRMGAGSFFGEMALLTGEPRTATIIAVTPTHLFEISKADLAPLLESGSGFYELLENVLQERRAELNQSLKMAMQTLPREADEDLIDRIRQYFGSR